MEKQIITEFDVPVPMRDGIVLRAVIIRPANEGKYPVLISRMPYSKDAAASYGPDGTMIDIYRTVKEGYVVVLQDTRGKFASEGEWDIIPVMNQEAEDGFDTIAWAAELPYSTGEVGTFGGSYLAFTQWCMMDKGIQAYKAAAPTTIWETPRDGFWYRGGALELGLFTVWALGLHCDTLGKMGLNEEAYMQALFHLSNDLEQIKEKLKALPLNNYEPFIHNQLPPSAMDIIRGGYENKSLVEKLSFTDTYANVNVPSLNIGGWYDVFLNGTINNFIGVKKHAKKEVAAKSKLVIGPWTHWTRSERVGTMFFGSASSAAATDLPGMHLRWFDQLLKQEDNGMEHEAPIKLFVMGENVWREEQEWPLDRTQYQPFYLHSQGKANSLQGDGSLSLQQAAEEPSDQYDYNPGNPVETTGGAFLVVPYYKEGPQDQRVIEDRDDVVVYTSEILEADVEVTGQIKANIWSSSSAPDTDFVVRLVDVHPDGYAQNLTDGILRARYRNFEQTGEVSLLRPDKPYLFEIDMWATSNVFKRGHRIRVDITSSSFPRWDRNSNTGHDCGVDTEADFVVARQRILHDKEHPSHILLPVIPR